MTNRRAFVWSGLVVVLIGAAIGVGRSDRYMLWKLRRDPDGAPRMAFDLCQQGHDPLPALYATFDAHISDDDGGILRVFVADVLRCVRRNDGKTTNDENAYADVPVDDALVGRIVRAFAAEPDAKNREAMLVGMSELDFRAEFAVYAGMVQSKYELPELYSNVPSPDPYRASVPAPANGENRRVEWCRVIHPIALARVEHDTVGKRSEFGREQLLEALGAAHCEEADVAILQHNAGERGMVGHGALAGLMQMTDSPDRATKTLAPLFANSDCSSQLSLLIELEDRLTPAIAEVVADAALPCYGKAPGDVDRCADSPADCRAEVIRMLTKAEHTHK